MGWGEDKRPWVQPGLGAQDSVPGEDTPQSEGQEQGDDEAEVGRAWPGGSASGVITATAVTAGDVEVAQEEGVCRMGALAPGSGGAASHGVTPVSHH